MKKKRGIKDSDLVFPENAVTDDDIEQIQALRRRLASHAGRKIRLARQIIADLQRQGLPVHANFDSDEE